MLVGVPQVLTESFLGEDLAFLELVHAFGGDHALLIDVRGDSLRNLVRLEGQRHLEEPQMFQTQITKQLFQMVHIVDHQVVHSDLVKFLGWVSLSWGHNDLNVELINDPHFFLTVIEGTLAIGVALLVITALSLVVAGVILLFFPAMAVITGSLEDAPLLVLADEGACLPVLA